MNCTRSDTYSYNGCQSSLKAVLLNKVIVGKGWKLDKNNETLTAPPRGFDSVCMFYHRKSFLIFIQSRKVLGEKGRALNHDELVVYTNDAIRPSYLVMYEP